jgi:hypothetical protein
MEPLCDFAERWSVVWKPPRYILLGKSIVQFCLQLISRILTLKVTFYIFPFECLVFLKSLKLCLKFSFGFLRSSPSSNARDTVTVNSTKHIKVENSQ